VTSVSNVEIHVTIATLPQVEDVMGQRGLIRNIAERFAGRPELDDSVPGAARGRSGVSPRRGPVPDKIVIERADGPAVLENEPAALRPDVVRSDASDYVDGPKVEPGSTRNLVACWKNKEIENSSPQVKLVVIMHEAVYDHIQQYSTRESVVLFKRCVALFLPVFDACGPQ
jgi:hypothetical protein